jgi:CubicO group peptidase (beta-lactamase class C family)
MQYRRRALVVLFVASLALSGCGNSSSDAAPAGAVEGVTGNPLEVTVSARAAERLGIQTTEVKGTLAGRTSVPYAAVLYDAQGGTWVYATSEQDVFVRTQVRVDRIDGDVALLLDGPPSGTSVVTVGLAELYGAETGVGDPE